MWKAVFGLMPNDALTLDEWLGQKLREPCRHYMGHAGRVVIEGPTRDDVFKTSEWIRNQNPFGVKLDYTVIGYEGTEIVYLSYCPKCRAGRGKHIEHVSK